MSKADDSFVAVLRAVIVMLHVDGRVDREEEKWFRHVLATCSLPENIEQQLLCELESPGSIEEILPLIRHPDDRRQLLALAKIAMQIDGKVDEREKELFDQILNAKEPKPGYADELVSHTNRIILWEKLKEAGRYLRRSRRGVLWSWRTPKE